MMGRVVVLGGTFDPPHIGHLIMAEYAYEALDARSVLFLPAADPPHKHGGTRADATDRVAMVLLAIDGEPRFELSRIDLDRPGPHYTADTVRLLAAAYPEDEVIFLVGEDSLRDLPYWHRADEIIRYARLAVVPRHEVRFDESTLEAVLPGIAERVVHVQSPLIEVSSTDLAARLRAGKSVRYQIPDRVLAYIRQHDLYGSTP
jgi:nicotinate-nucleotide adenylyltransferase